MDEAKVLAVKDWPVPMTVKDLQSFLGFANFYRRFIWVFSYIVASLIALLKKGLKKFQWYTSA